MSVTIQNIGKRWYLRGNTYPLKDKLKEAGAHWDADERAWWFGAEEKAKAILADASDVPAPKPDRGLEDDDEIAGRAEYKGKTFILVWEGHTQRGHAAKLAYTDGSKTFWVDYDSVKITKRYETREYGQVQRMTLGRLRQLQEEWKAKSTAEKRAIEDDREV